MKRNRIFDALAVKSEDIGNKMFANYRRKRLNNTDFTIISNNCWGGHVYRRYGLEYSSPTVGLYFYADDYIKFLSNLKFYLDSPLEFIDVNSSKYKDDLITKGQENVIIGKLGDEVEMIFLHYDSRDEALEKWNRRKKRVNYDNLIVKFSQMNNCTEKHIEEFAQMPFSKKVVFVGNETNIPGSVLIKRYKADGCVVDDTTYFASHINLDKLINSKGEDGNVVI